jgi:hypothetical protein
MDGAQTHTGEGGELSPHAVPLGLPTPSASPAVGQRRRRRRHSSLSSKLRRNHKMARVRKAIALVFLGLAVVGISIYLARSSTAYEPVPSAISG